MPGGDVAIAKLSVPDIASFVRVVSVHLSPTEAQAAAAHVCAAAARTRP